MKPFYLNTLIALSLLICTNTIQAQNANNLNQNETKNFFLEKSRHQKSAGWILLGTGTAMACGGLIGFGNSWDTGSPTETDIYGFVFLTGIIANLTSIPFFLSAGNNRKKAATLSFSCQNTFFKLNNTHSLSIQPTLTLRIGPGNHK